MLGCTVQQSTVRLLLIPKAEVGNQPYIIQFFFSGRKKTITYLSIPICRCETKRNVHGLNKLLVATFRAILAGSARRGNNFGPMLAELSNAANR